MRKKGKVKKLKKKRKIQKKVVFLRRKETGFFGVFECFFVEFGVKIILIWLFKKKVFFFF